MTKPKKKAAPAAKKPAKAAPAVEAPAAKPKARTARPALAPEVKTTASGQKYIERKLINAPAQKEPKGKK